MSIYSFTEAIHLATKTILLDDRVHILGLGAVYPNGLDGTMGTLAREFPDRIHDTPCSEAAVSGMGVGMAAMGLRPLIHHGRIEFCLWAMDAVITQAAKWNSMFGGGYPLPLTMRIAMGRQWGNGGQHTNNSKCLFATSGLKVVCPSTPQMAHDLLISAMEDYNPVIYLEPRWCYKLKEEISTKQYGCDLGKARVLKRGTDITLVAVGDTVVEALRTAKMLKGQVDVEVIDLVSVYPMDSDTILESVGRTKHLIVCESSTYPYSTASQVIELVGMNYNIPKAYSVCPDYPCPTAPSLTKDYYPTSTNLANFICSRLFGLGEFEENETFEQLNLPPTDNITDLLNEVNS